MSFCSTRPCLRALEAAARQNDAGYDAHQQDPPLDTESAEMRRAANEAVMEDRWDDALALYGRLLERVPWLAQTWAARAIVLLRRGWKGDALCALRDADTCAALSPHWPKAYETRIRCLRSLGQVRPCQPLLEGSSSGDASRALQSQFPYFIADVATSVLSAICRKPLLSGL